MILLPLLLQITPVQPLPKGTALPPPEAPEAGPMTAVDAVMRAIATHDPALLLAHVTGEGDRLTGAIEGDQGTRLVRTSWAAFADKVKGVTGAEERLTDPAIELDGDIAMVWSPYVFLRDGKVEHCGVDHFDLVRENNGWKVQSVTWTQRTTGCDAR